jgi:hypothetical protein
MKITFAGGRQAGRTYAQQMLIVAQAVLEAAKNLQTVAKIEITVIEEKPREKPYTLITEDF